MRLTSICADCAAPYRRDDSNKRGTCTDCSRPERQQAERRRSDYRQDKGLTTKQRGYTGAWRRLSERARELSPLCEDCGATDDLTGDHSVEAWQRYAAGKTIRLKDIAVVCRTCNAERGAARGESASDDHRGGAAYLDLWGGGVDG